MLDDKIYHRFLRLSAWGCCARLARQHGIYQHSQRSQRFSGHHRAELAVSVPLKQLIWVWFGIWVVVIKIRAGNRYRFWSRLCPQLLPFQVFKLSVSFT